MGFPNMSLLASNFIYYKIIQHTVCHKLLSIGLWSRFRCEVFESMPTLCLTTISQDEMLQPFGWADYSNSFYSGCLYETCTCFIDGVTELFFSSTGNKWVLIGGLKSIYILWVCLIDGCQSVYSFFKKGPKKVQKRMRHCWKV